MKTTMDAWRKFRRLSGGERSVVLEAAGALAGTWLGMRLIGFGSWKNFLVRFLPPEKSLASVEQSELFTLARQISRLELAAARHLPLRTNCLERSLVLWWLLERRGIAAEIRVGARKDANRFEAHAWVEQGGAVLNEPEEEHLHFAPFDGPVANWEAQ